MCKINMKINFCKRVRKKMIFGMSQFKMEAALLKWCSVKRNDHVICRCSKCRCQIPIYRSREIGLDMRDWSTSGDDRTALVIWINFLDLGRDTSTTILELFTSQALSNLLNNITIHQQINKTFSSYIVIAKKIYSQIENKILFIQYILLSKWEDILYFTIISEIEKFE